jgi:DMSO/TMAO reductase YedYZ molybdopterin-dependent catalytic subunit
MTRLSRRALLAAGLVAAAGAAGAILLAVGRRFGLVPPDARDVYAPGATLTYAAHRLFARHALAREFPKAMISAKPLANELAPPTEAFKRHAAEGFANWTLEVSGLVDRPATFSLAALRAMPMHSQITEVICEEGWSYIAEWTGTSLAELLAQCGAQANARYVVYFSSDPEWWESIDIDEARHPQTLLAWQMNGETLPVPFGGPLRMRVPRQLGYKSVKFIDRIVVAESLDGFGDGTGQAPGLKGYAWYTGI